MAEQLKLDIKINTEKLVENFENIGNAMLNAAKEMNKKEVITNDLSYPGSITFEDTETIPNKGNPNRKYLDVFINHLHAYAQEEVMQDLSKIKLRLNSIGDQLTINSEINENQHYGLKSIQNKFDYEIENKMNEKIEKLVQFINKL